MQRVAHLPNIITASRLLLGGAAICVVLAAGGPPGYRWAFILLVIAGCTDYIDGWIARRFNCITTLGTFFDPLVDKILANLLLVVLAMRAPEWVSLELVLLILAREFVVQGFRSIAPLRGVVLRTLMLNKLKLVFQLVCGVISLAGLAWPGLAGILLMPARLALLLALAFAYISMATLMIRNRDLWSRPKVDMEMR